MSKPRTQITNCLACLQSIPVLIALLAFLVTSCAPTKPIRNRDAMLPEVDLLQLKENGDLALKLAQQCRVSIDELNLRVTNIERTMAQLNSSTEVIPPQMDDLQTQLALMRDVIVQLRQAIAYRGNPVPTFNPNLKRKLPSENKSLAPEPFSRGWKLFQEKSYPEAITAFELMNEKFPENDWVAESWYWMGESYLAIGDYSHAISSFQKVFTYIESDKTDDAQFMIATCFLKMGDRQRAVVEFKKIDVLFPDSEYVPKAQAELQKLQAK